MTPQLFIGIDGGGTSTRALALDTSGKTIGVGTAPGSNPNNIGYPQSAANILSAIEQCKIPLGPETSLCLGIAGLASQEHRQQLQQALLATEPKLAAAKLTLTHDLEIAHYAAFQGKPGIILIAGTGSACYAINAAGQTFRASGRDFHYDDPGSGYAIGKRAIDTQLLPPADSRQSIAALAPRVIELATLGDIKALDVLRIEAENLTKLAKKIYRELEPSEPFPKLALNGSILTSDTLYRHTMLFELHSALPNIQIAEATLTPTQAAAHLAQNRK